MRLPLFAAAAVYVAAGVYASVGGRCQGRC